MPSHEAAHQDNLDAVVQRQVNDLVRQGLDTTSLKLSLLAEGWRALQCTGLNEPYTAEDFARRLCADRVHVQEQLQEMVTAGFFEQVPSSKQGKATCHLTTDPARRDALRPMLLSWGDIRFRLHANMIFAFRPGAVAARR